MNQGEVLELFMEEANKLGNTHRRMNDTILSLAQLLADSKEKLSEETFAAFVNIGATIYKASRIKAKARADIASIMKDSIDKGKNG